MSYYTGIEVEEKETIECTHNYTTLEEHFGEKVYVTRKGAIDAHKDILGLVPGFYGHC